MSAVQPTSLTLLQRLRAQDQEAWDRLLHLYAPLVRSWCAHQGIRGADADDLVQEVFQAVVTSLPSFQRDRPGDTFRGWLCGITRHKMLDLFRRRLNQPQAEGGTAAGQQLQEVPVPEMTLPDESAEEVAGLYQRAIEFVKSEFETKTWTAFWRTAVDEQSPADAAAELGMTAAAVRMAKCRVLHRLRQEIGDLS